jgi:MFS family permease
VTTPTAAPHAALRAHPGDLRILGPWFLAVFLNSYAVTLYCAGSFDFAGERLGAPASTQLWLSAGWGFAYIFISLMAGKITERWGARRTILIMASLSILASLLGVIMVGDNMKGWAGGAWLLLALMIPMNITTTSCWPALESAISRSIGNMRLSTRMAIYNLSWAGAGFVAFFTRGALEHFSWASVFVVPAITMAASLLILLFWGISQEAPASEQPDESSADSEAIKRRAVTLLHMAWVGNALAYVGINVITPVLMRMAEQSNIQNLTLAGIVTSVWGFCRFAGFMGVAQWTGWHYKARWLVGSQLALAGSFLLMLVIPNIWILVLAQIIFGFATALIYSSSLYYAMHTSEGSGGHAGFHEALIGVGIFVGPAIGALAGGDSLGMDALRRIGYSVTGVLLVGALVMWFMGARKPARAGAAAVIAETERKSL